jgi:CHAT domain-containing protein
MAANEKIIEQLALLADEAGRKKYLARHRRLFSPSLVAELDDAVSARLRKDLSQSQALAEAALAIAKKLDNKEATAHALRAKANTLWFEGHNQQAVELHAQAIALFAEAGNALEEARTLSVSIQPLNLLGEYERALAAAERARALFSAAGDALRLARLDINVGNIFHRQDRFREALEYYQRALQQLLPVKETEGIIAALHNIAVCMITLNEYQEALSAYEQARQFCLANNLPRAVVQADYNIAYLYYFRGEYGRAIEMLRAVREDSERVGDLYHTALCHLDLSEIYLELNMSQETQEMAQAAYTRFQELGMGYEAAKALCNTAIAFSQENKGFRALDLFAQARALFVKEQNKVWPYLIDLYQGWVLHQEGRLFEARRYALAALDFFRTSPLPGRALLCRLLIVRLSLKAGDAEAARQECREALESLTGKEAPILVYQAHLLMGEIEERGGNLDAAEHHYLAAKRLLETLRGRVHGEELKISFMKNRVEAYESLINLCLARGATPDSQKQAWSYMEQAKSRSLLDLVSRPVTSTPTDDLSKSHLVRQIRDLREQLNWYYHRIEAEQLGQVSPSENRLLELRDQAERSEKEFLRVLRELPAADAEAAGLPPAEPVPLDDLRAILGSEATLVEYFRVRDHIIAAILTADGLEIAPVTLAPRVTQGLRMLRFQLSKFRLDPDYIRQFQAPLLEATRGHLRELYNELVAPIRSRLKGKHLVVAPHESLHYVPFHALFDGNQYLVDSYTVSYAPSASIFAQCQRKPANAGSGALILGVPSPQTPSIYEELQSVAMILPKSELFVGPDASRKILNEKGPNCRVIHIATHGFFRPDNPMFSGVRLGDTFLTLYDLYSLRLPVDLITLSGCSTGLNVVAAGDELMGLVRGLLTAGARTLLLTLWDVNDQSTAQFMKSFYSRANDQPNRAVALREAMQELRERYPHPYYWAPFTLIGKVLPT